MRPQCISREAWVNLSFPVRRELCERFATAPKVRSRVSDLFHRSDPLPMCAEVYDAVAAPPHALPTFPGRARSHVPPFDSGGPGVLRQKRLLMRTSSLFVGSVPPAPLCPASSHFPPPPPPPPPSPTLLHPTPDVSTIGHNPTAARRTPCAGYAVWIAGFPRVRPSLQAPLPSPTFMRTSATSTFRATCRSSPRSTSLTRRGSNV